MKRPDSRHRWRTIGSMVMALATVTIVGAATVTPAKADYDDWRYRQSWRERHERGEWRERREWREEHPRAGVYFSYPAPNLYYDYYSR